jgi:hypothetical protein
MVPRTQRVTIAGLLGLILLLGIGFAALRSPSWLWANALLSCAVALVVFAVIAAIELRGPARAFWRAFAICGGCYLLLSAGMGHVGVKLVTTTLLDVVYPQLSPPPATPTGPSWGAGNSGSVTISTSFAPPATFSTPPGGGPGGTVSLGSLGPGPSRWQAWTAPDRVNTADPMQSVAATIFSPEAFRQIGHSVFGVLFAALGGRLAVWMSSRRGDADSVSS